MRFKGKLHQHKRSKMRTSLNYLLSAEFQLIMLSQVGREITIVLHFHLGLRLKTYRPPWRTKILDNGLVKRQTLARTRLSIIIDYHRRRVSPRSKAVALQATSGSILPDKISWLKTPIKFPAILRTRWFHTRPKTYARITQGKHIHTKTSCNRNMV